MTLLKQTTAVGVENTDNTMSCSAPQTDFSTSACAHTPNERIQAVANQTSEIRARSFTESEPEIQTSGEAEQKLRFLRKQSSPSFETVIATEHPVSSSNQPQIQKNEKFDSIFCSQADDWNMEEDGRCTVSWQENLWDSFPDKDGDTLLHLAILHQLSLTHLAMLTLRTAGLQEQVNHPNHLHQTPLHLAVLTGHLQSLPLLRYLGASLTAQDAHGNTPLHAACQRNDLRALKILCQEGDEIGYEGDDGVVEASSPEAEKDSERGGRTAGEEKRREEVKFALGMKNYEGFTCLHLAVLNGNPELVVLLLQNGADINEKEGKSGRTALHLAVDTALPCTTLLTLLLLHPRLHINATNFAQQSALQLARGRGHLHLVDLLHAHGADWSESCHSCNSMSDDEDDDFIMMYGDMCIAGQSVTHEISG